MPAMGLKIVSVACQYGMLLVLLVYLMRLVRLMGRDYRREMRELRAPQVKADEALLLVTEARASSGLKGRRFAFAEGMTIGRGEDNDVVIPDAFVSHHHARIFAHGNQFVLEDLGSRNHTYLNGTALSGRTYLKPGDEIRIGFVTMRFERQGNA